MLDHYLTIITHNWQGSISTLIFVMLLLNFATGKLEEQLSLIGKKLKLPPSVRGATFDAISSSLPEFLTALLGLVILKEKGLEVGIGTISGSAIFNILIIPFFALLVYKGKNIILDSKAIKRDSIFYILSIAIFLLGLYFKNLFLMGLVLLILYGIYIFTLYLSSKNTSNKQELLQEFNEVKNKKINFFNIIYSLIFIYIGVELSIYSAEFIGKSLGIPTLVISLVLLAAITSIPDTLLSVKASKKGDIDASLSNAVGSNIFDICIGLGLPIMIGIGIMDLNPKVDFFSQIPIFGFLVLSVLFYVFLLTRKVTKKSGYILGILYFIFIAYLFYGF